MKALKKIKDKIVLYIDMIDEKVLCTKGRKVKDCIVCMKRKKREVRSHGFVQNMRMNNNMNHFMGC